MRFSTVKIVLGIIGGTYRPDRRSPAAPGAGQDAQANLPSGRDGQTLPPSRPRRPRKRRYIWLVGSGLVIAALAVPYVGHALLHPWAISLTGQPTLTGHWHGEVAFEPGDPRRVVVDLRSDPPVRRCQGCSPIDGVLKVCTGARPAAYEFTGDVKNRSARRFSLSVTPSDGPGTYLRWLDGEWAGGDQISGTAIFVVRDTDGAIRSDHQPPPVRFTMRRGTEANFTAAC